MPDDRAQFVRRLGKFLHTHDDGIVNEPLPKRLVARPHEIVACIADLVN